MAQHIAWAFHAHFTTGRIACPIVPCATSSYLVLFLFLFFRYGSKLASHHSTTTRKRHFGGPLYRRLYEENISATRHINICCDNANSQYWKRSEIATGTYILHRLQRIEHCLYNFIVWSVNIALGITCLLLCASENGFVVAYISKTSRPLFFKLQKLPGIKYEPMACNIQKYKSDDIMFQNSIKIKSKTSSWRSP